MLSDPIFGMFGMVVLAWFLVPVIRTSDNDVKQTYRSCFTDFYSGLSMSEIAPYHRKMLLLSLFGLKMFFLCPCHEVERGL